MKTIVRHVVVLMLCVGSGVQADIPVKNQVDTPVKKTELVRMSSLDAPDIVAQFLGQVDAIVQILDGNDIDDASQLKIALVAQQIENRAARNLRKEKEREKLKLDLTIRSGVAKDLLSPARYSALEKACVNKLKPGNEDVRILAMHVLSRSLGSSAGKPYMEATLAKALKAIEDNEEMGISAEEFFAVAENLAYLGNANGLEVFKSVLRSDGSPSVLKQRAIEALPYLGHTIMSIQAEYLLLSKDASVAKTAFDSIKRPEKDPTVVAAAVAQIQALKAAYLENKQTLLPNQRSLLWEISQVFLMASREGTLPHDDLPKVKTVIVFFAGVDNEKVQEGVISSFAELANDDDSDLIARLFTSGSSKVREFTALAIAKCSSKTIHSQSKTLIKFLDDNSPGGLRDYALYALMKGLGEKTGNVFSDTEFKIQKAKVLEKYKE